MICTLSPPTHANAKKASVAIFAKLLLEGMTRIQKPPLSRAYLWDLLEIQNDLACDLGAEGERVMTCCSLDLKDIKVVTKLGGTVDDSELVDGVVFDQKASKTAGGPTRVENAKVALIQFCISPPKTDLENNVIISDYTQMDR